MIHYIENEQIRVGVKEFGGELTVFFDKTAGFEYLWQGDPDVWYGQSPVLFPVIGRLKDDGYTLGGVRYSCPKHGVARKRPFALVSRTDDTMTFLQTEDENTLRQFPYRYRLYEIFTIRDRTLSVELRVENTDDKTMYFGVGAHPGFNCRIGDIIEFSENETLDSEMIDMDLCLRKTESFPVLRNDNKIEITEHIFDEDALILKGIRSDHLTLHAFGGEKDVVFRFNSEYLGIWAKPGAPYVCLEPWCGVDDSTASDGIFETKEGNHKIAPGESFSLFWSAEI
ncbi:MAG: aldose 1-epimerase family protein [Clostridia bacterium]|nr:aldose 1-epimerase family protein [Clostridia bacterium]MBR5427967.1 aldose 1-epimerase family protein [Clostridia bacterium]